MTEIRSIKVKSFGLSPISKLSAMVSVDHLLNVRSFKHKIIRINLLAIFMVFLLASTIKGYAQKLEVEWGSLAFLKGQKFVNIVINYDSLYVQGQREIDYLAMEEPEWIKSWQESKAIKFKEKLIEELNDELRSLEFGYYPNAEYTATILVLSIRRGGINVGPATVTGELLEGPGLRVVTCEVFFTATSNSQPMAKIAKFIGTSETNAPGGFGSFIGAAGSNSHLTGFAFGAIGEALGEFLKKQLKKIKK